MAHGFYQAGLAGFTKVATTLMQINVDPASGVEYSVRMLNDTNTTISLPCQAGGVKVSRGFVRNTYV